LETRNEEIVGSMKLVYSMVVVKIILYLHARMAGKNRTGHKRKREKRPRDTEERVRDKVWLETGVASLVKVTVKENTCTYYD